jgi:thiol-disulfide isomerase/thioredoxin
LAANINILFGVVFTAVLLMLGCSTGADKQGEEQTYLATFSLDDSTTVDVLVSLKQDDLVFMNGKERVLMRSVSGGGYSVPVFGGALVGEWMGEGVERIWRGDWVDSLRTKEYRVPLEIAPVKNKSVRDGNVQNSVWDTDLGKLKMVQKGDSISATFLTSTGDYRYQAGEINPETSRFKFGNFDGIHLFSFEGTIAQDSITNGVFKSGTHYTTNWSGVRSTNNRVDWSATQEWNPQSNVFIEGVNSGGETEIWTRERLGESGYKVLVVDVMGTWCPNCMDEARLLKELCEDYPEMIVVSMAFERSVGEDAIERIADFKEEMKLPWEVLLGGIANKRIADSTLSFMGGVKSFPTTAFIPFEGDPVIHSGFSGPATGESYEEEVLFFRNTIESLIRESR